MKNLGNRIINYLMKTMKSKMKMKYLNKKAKN